MKALKSLNSLTSKSEKINFLTKNRKQILKEKKAFPKFGDSLNYDFPKKENSLSMAEILKDGEVAIIGNSVGFMDSHMDVSMTGSWTKTVNERGNLVPIIKDHDYKVDNIFAENKGAFVSKVLIKDLGYQKAGETEVLGAIIKPNADMLEKYQSGLIKQHSVGLQYVKLGLAVNDPEDEEGYKEWIANIDKVINREEAEREGFFFPVYEQKLIEISAVVFGSNPYTPAFKDNKSLETKEPLEDTQKEVKPIEKGKDFLQHLIY